MLRVRSGAPRGLLFGSFGFIIGIASVSIAFDSSNARGHRHRSSSHEHHATSSYQPAYSAIVVDGNTGTVMHASNPDALRHPASLTKIMTLYLLFERLESGKLKLDSPLQISGHAAGQDPTKLGLKPGQTIEVEDAIKGIVTRSANDAAAVVAENIGGSEDDFAEMMTQKARALGMSHTTYVNASGLPADEQITTARDQATLGRAIQERFPKYYRYFSTRVFNYHGVAIGNHNHLLGSVEGVDGIKTGYTRASGFNLVTSVHRDNKYLVGVVLGGSSGGSRDARMRELVAQYIPSASAKRTTSMVAEVEKVEKVAEKAAAPAPEPKATERPEPKAAGQRYSVASFTAVPVPAPAPAPVAAAPARRPPAAGSADPIHPVMVKTLTFKTSPVQTAGLAPTPRAQAYAAETPNEPPATVKAAPPVPPAMPLNSRSAGAPAMIASAAPTGSLPEATPIAVPAPAPVAAAAPPSPPKPQQAHTGWMIQVGAFPAEEEAKQKLNTVKSKAGKLLGSADPFTEAVSKGDQMLYRARFAGLDKDQAEAACKYLKKNDVACMALKN
jgi:D-alanyl-D-alanine carboxypeptidase